MKQLIQSWQPQVSCPPPPCPSPPWFESPYPPWYKTNYVSFGSAAPSSPARGNLWWNGLVLQIWDGAGWMPVGGAGDVTGTAAAPGAIGEVVMLSYAMPIVPAGSDVVFSPVLGVPAGDWDCNAVLSYDGQAAGVSFTTMGSPLPGLMPDIAGGQASSVPGLGFRAVSAPARFLTPVTVVLGFKLLVSQPAGNAAALAFNAWCRRAR